MFETLKHVLKTEKRCSRVFKDKYVIITTGALMQHNLST